MSYCYEATYCVVLYCDVAIHYRLLSVVCVVLVVFILRCVIVGQRRTLLGITSSWMKDIS